jgi:spermidine synthase
MQRKDTAKEMPKDAPELPEVNFSDYGDVRFLHLGTEWVQGSMLRDAPYDIELEYVQRMMAGLLFMDAASLPKKHAMQLGLGSAALTKFCYKKLRMKTTAIEINPQVVTACRVWFKLPRDDLRLHVIEADASVEIKSPRTTARWTCCTSTSTTMKRPRRCWTAPTFTPTAAPCWPRTA